MRSIQLRVQGSALGFNTFYFNNNRAVIIVAVSIRRFVLQRFTKYAFIDCNLFFSSCVNHHSGHIYAYISFSHARTFFFFSSRESQLWSSNICSDFSEMYLCIWYIDFWCVIFGICRPNDCSAASSAMVCNLRSVFSLTSRMVDLSEGKKIISWLPISASFCTMSSILSIRFANAIHNTIFLFFLSHHWLFVSIHEICQIISFFVIISIVIVYLLWKFPQSPLLWRSNLVCSKNFLPDFILSTVWHWWTMRLSLIVMMLSLTSKVSEINNCIVVLSVVNNLL